MRCVCGLNSHIVAFSTAKSLGPKIICYTVVLKVLKLTHHSFHFIQDDDTSHLQPRHSFHFIQDDDKRTHYGYLCLWATILWFYLFFFPNELTKIYDFRNIQVGSQLGPLQCLVKSYFYKPCISFFFYFQPGTVLQLPIIFLG